MKKKLFGVLSILLLGIWLVQLCGCHSNQSVIRTSLRSKILAREGSVVSFAMDSYYAVTDDKKLIAWGDIPTTDDFMPDANGQFFIMENAVWVDAAFRVTLIIDTEGTLWACGSNIYGQLGSDFGKNGTLVKILDHVVKAKAGERHCLALREDGSLWSWGFNDLGQLGIGSIDTDANVRIVHTPTKIMENIEEIEAYCHASYAIDTEGGLWGWGEVDDEQCILSPVKFKDSVVQIAATWKQLYGVMDNGELQTVEVAKFGDVNKDYHEIEWDFLLPDVVFVTQEAAIQEDGSLYVWDEWEDEDLITPMYAMDEISFATWANRYILAVTNDHELWAVDIEKLKESAN